ncbi:MAG: hypothetical protein FWH43_07765 [Endomicrobia bacterium]|nr:hypothetical protein [Endomicrobiia bacterium]MCL2145367.1 hypothetical protein [Endomicrobiia bacterium]
MYKISGNLEKFLSLPAEIYEGDPFYTPKPESLPQNAKLFVIDAIARAAVIQEDGFVKIGWFEAFNEPAAVKFLFDAIKNVYNTRIIGPINGSTWHKYRVSLPDNKPPFFLDNYNKPYYAQLFESNDFKPLARYISTICKNLNKDYSRVERFEKNLKSKGITVRAFDNDLRAIYDISVKSFSDNFLYTPISYEEFQYLYRPVLPLMNPDWALIAEDKDKTPLAFIFALDNLFAKDKKSLVIKTLAKLPDCKIKGLGVYLAEKLYKQAFDSGYSEIIHAFMHEKNNSTNILAQDAELLRKYILYEWRQDD